MGAGRRRGLGSALPLLLLLGGCAVAPPLAPDPLSAEEHNDLGVAYHGRGEHALAARQFRQALGLRPGWARALANLAQAQLAMGDIDAAIGTYEEARRASPDDPAIANDLAWALLQHEERWREAEPVIRAALGQAPEPRGYYLDTLGVLLLRKGAAAEALAAFRAALVDPGLADRRTRALVLEHTGRALAGLGDAAGAARCFGAALALRDPRAEKVGGGDTVC